LKKVLYCREQKAHKPKGRLLGDGHPRVLTGDSFVGAVQRHQEAVEAAEADASKKKEERAAVAQLKAMRKSWMTG